MQTAPPVLRLVLPSSLSAAQAEQLARYLAAYVGQGVHVAPAESYDRLFFGLRAGRNHAAWAPPFLCARLESAGMRVLVWGVRKGRPTYRSALLARAGSGLTLEALAGTAAAWVEPESTGGHLLAVVLLKERGLDPARTFRAQAFVGTYRKALEAVRDGAADVAAVYCPPEATGQTWEAGAEEALPGETRRFALVSYTAEAPNAGLVVSPTLTPSQAAALERAFVELPDTEAGRALLRDVFSGMERFEPAPPHSYQALYQLAVSSR